ncbi:MAG: hypothetical protein EBS49_04635 [Verrucomicrobia bacterium]|nr:hypothetical protein [Verrucomicrobiota bacterium]NBU68892.1 hypothetical protein [Verrucomicrobiota bacterium]
MRNRLEVKALRISKFELGNSEKAKIGDRRWKTGRFLSPISQLPSPARRMAGCWMAVLLVAVGMAAAQEGGWKEDLKRMGFDEVPIGEMEKGEIVGQKWIVGGARPGFLGAKAFFLSPASPEKTARVVLEFDPTRGKDLAWTDEGSVKLYHAFQRPGDAGTWSRFRAALGRPPFDLLLQVEGRKEGKIHLHAEELAKVSSGKIDGWVRILEEKMQTYHRGGWKENAGVPSGPDMRLDFDEELRDVLKENGPVRDEFRRVLTALAYGGQDKKEPVEVRDYWQLMEVDKAPAVALGCAVMKQGAGGRYEVADMHYFASNGYYGAISLYGIWPYGDGKSLVCRIDAVETDPEQLAQATARMIGEALFMKEVKAGCQTILSRLKGS